MAFLRPERNLAEHMHTAPAATVLIAAVSTLGDFVWAGLGLRHRMVFGLTHGTLLFLCIGAYLGSIDRQPRRGAIAGALIGPMAAGSFGSQCGPSSGWRSPR